MGKVKPLAFLARAQEEARRYGGDPYIFLRELAQNARDADATRIEIEFPPGTAHRILFRDDGCGMSFAHARSFLFRLYASSKEGEGENAGRFGVGFWSVLRWQPQALVITSRSSEEAWGVQLSLVDGAARMLPCAVPEEWPTGTTVILEAPVGANDVGRGLEALSKQVKQAVAHYCPHLKQRRRPREAIAISVQGEPVEQSMSLPGPWSSYFSGPGVEGVVGFGQTPKVVLYARGLWLTERSYLEELLVGGEPPARGPEARGLAPVLLINSDALEVVLSRQQPIEGPELKRLVRLGQKQVQRLSRAVIDGAFPRPWSERLRDLWEWGLRQARNPWVLLLLGTWVLTASLVYDGAQRWSREVPNSVPTASVKPNPKPAPNRGFALNPSQGAVPAPSAVLEIPPSGGSEVYSNLRGYRGPRPDVLEGPQRSWDLRYSGGPQKILFKALTLDRYDAQQGWVRAEAPWVLHSGYRCPSKECVQVILGRAWIGKQPLILPLPTGFGLEPHSVELGSPDQDAWSRLGPQRVLSNRWGEVALHLPGVEEMRSLRYRVGPQRSPRPTVGKLKEFEGERWPVRLRARLRRFGNLPPGRRARAVSRWVSELLRYDLSPETALAFEQSKGTWFEKVVQSRGADCDVKNGLNVLALHELGIPARLAVGIPAELGRGKRGLHAWTEVWEGGRWRARDASGMPSREALSRLRDQGVFDESSIEVGSVDPPSFPPRRSLDPRASDANRAVEPPPPPPVGVRQEEGPGLQESWVPVEVVDLPAARKSDGRLLNAMRAAKAWMLSLILVAVVVTAGLLWRRRLRGLDMSIPQGAQGQEAVAHILLNVLTGPGWQGSRELWFRRVLPTFSGDAGTAPREASERGGRRLSLAEALSRAAEGSLWVSVAGSELATLAARNGQPVLDGSDPHFGAVIAALGRAIDLDALSRLKPLGALDSELRPFLDRSNALLASVGVRARIHGVSDLPFGTVRDVDLSKLHLPVNASSWPSRFIAVGANDPGLRELAGLAHSEPRRALLLWLERLADRSEFVRERVLNLRRRVAFSFWEVA